MGHSRHARARKASWLAFGLIALASASSYALDTSSISSISEVESSTITSSLSNTPTSSEASNVQSAIQTAVPADTANEAARAYRQAIYTLNSLTSLPVSYASSPAIVSSWSSSSPLLSYIFPNFQGQGPAGSLLRILNRLRQRFQIASRVGQDVAGGRRRRDNELHTRAIKVVDLLQHAAELGHMDALYVLAKISLLPPTPHFPGHPALAYQSFQAHADQTGNGTSQAALAFFHATGYHDIVPVNQAKAQLYYTFAAHGGDRGAQMALGYRYWSGIGVAEDCGRAVEWYEHAAGQAMAKFMSGPPGGRTLPLTPSRISDLDGGVFGFGASVASTSLNTHRPAIKAARARSAGETWEDILEYYIFNADRGETDFAFRLGKIFYQGSIYSAPGGTASGGEGVGRLPRDFERARYYFERIARQIWPHDPIDPLSHNSRREEGSGPVGYAAAAAGYLGRMHLRGEGVRPNAAIARMWFERGAEYGDKECHNGLGIIWRDGLVNGRRDQKRAVHHFGVAAGQDLAEAQVNLGKYHYARKEMKLATTYFETATRHGSPFEAYYYLAQIQSAQMNMMPPHMKTGACSIALSFYKIVAERGSWDDDLLRDGELDWESGTAAGKENAMLRWWIAAERGYEMAQNNLAYVLDQDKSVLKDPRFTSFSPSNDTARLALTQWTRSAAQNNVDALVKVGDYYYHGLGVPEEPETVRWEKAAGYYQSAADTQVSALAMWNLGWMYENGYGVPQDFHLAKRHYDVALETNNEAYLPVTLSLIKLHVRSFWHTLMGGKDGLSLWEYDEDSHAYVNEDKRQQLEDGSKLDSANQVRSDDEDILGEAVEDDAPWYLGRAREEFNRRRRGQGPGDDEDPVEWARERRNAENERDSDFGPEDYFEGALRGGHRGEEDADEFTETMVLVGLCLVVTLLLYIRGRMVERMRRDQGQPPPPNGGAEQQQQQQQQQQDGGLFPPPGDPARDDWAIAR